MKETARDGEEAEKNVGSEEEKYKIEGRQGEGEGGQGEKHWAWNSKGRGRRVLGEDRKR